MDQLLFIRDRKLVSSDIFMDRVDVFSGGLKVKECISKNDVRYMTHLFCSSLLLISVRLVRRSDFY
jgi:hypothetical protein